VVARDAAGRRNRACAIVCALLNFVWSLFLTPPREWCDTDPSWDVPVKVLYDAYKAWAEETGNKASPRHVFGKAY
jgi:hypothetical protein